MHCPRHDRLRRPTREEHRPQASVAVQRSSDTRGSWRQSGTGSSTADVSVRGRNARAWSNTLRCRHSIVESTAAGGSMCRPRPDPDARRPPPSADRHATRDPGRDTDASPARSPEGPHTGNPIAAALFSSVFLEELGDHVGGVERHRRIRAFVDHRLGRLNARPAMAATLHEAVFGGATRRAARAA